MRRFLPILILLLTACGATPQAAEQPTVAPTPACQQQIAPFVAQVQPIFQEWQDATTLAGSMPRASLSAQVDKLQGIRRKVQGLQAPDCATTVRENLVTSMDTTIQAYLQFLAQKPDNEVSALFTLATQQLDLFSRNLAHVQAGEVLESSPRVSTTKVTTLGSLPALTQPYQQAGITFQDRTLADGRPSSLGKSPDSVVVIEFIGPKDSIQEASMIVSGGAKDRAFVSMGGLISALMPDWKEGEVWVKGATDKSGTQTIAVRNRLVTLEHLGSDLLLTVKLT